MKHYLIILLFIVAGCSSKYEIVSHDSFNKKIKDNLRIQTAEALIKEYYNFPDDEEIRNMTIQTKELGDHRYQITLIHDRLEDDSQRAIKIVMIAEKVGRSWQVQKIKKSYKCWEGRGHTNWNYKFCN